MDSRDRGGSVLRGEGEGHSGPSGNSYAFVKHKKKEKKEKGYKGIGMDSSEEEYNDDVAMISSSGSHAFQQPQFGSPTNPQLAPLSSGAAGYGYASGSSGVKSSKSKPFRLKKKKSFKDKSAEHPAHSGDPLQVPVSGEKEKTKAAKMKHKDKSTFQSHTNPFDDRPFAVAPLGKKLSTSDKGSLQDESDTQIFGIPLSKAVQIDRCPDGLEIPAFFRVCVNYIEDNGLDTIGVYRTSGSQSRIQELKQHFNRGDRVRLNDYDVATVADVMKVFIRELPHKLVPEEYLLDLEEAADAPDFGKKVEMAQKILNRLELCRRTLLGWIFVHMSHIIDHQDTNKMTLKNVALVLEPTLRIQSNKVLNFLLTFPTEIFHDVRICKLAGPGQVLSSPEPVAVQSSSGTTEQALLQLREELVKKEASLNQLHHEIKQGKASKRKEEQLWDIQRQVTQLKRKIRTFEKMTTVTLSSTSAYPSDIPRKPSSSSAVSSPPSSTTFDQPPHPKPTRQPMIQVETRPAAMLVPVKSYPEPQSQEAPVVDKDWVDSGDVVARKEDVEQLVSQWCLYEALLGHNRSLRERIRKEEEGLEKVWEELAGMSRPTENQGEQLTDENVDVGAMRRELVDLVEKYRTHKQMSSELNDAVCSESADWIRIVGELNALKMRAA